jgi:hypothetical protein
VIGNWRGCEGETVNRRSAAGAPHRALTIALRHTQFAEATCGTIRLKLFKIGALVRVSVRRIKIAMASACPYQNEFALAHLRLTATAH